MNNYRLYLIEYYDNEGLISFAWIYATNKTSALSHIRMLQDWNETIHISEHAEKLPLYIEKKAKTFFAPGR